MEKLTKNELTIKSFMEQASTFDFHTDPIYSSECDSHGNYARGWWTRNAQQGYNYIFLGSNVGQAMEFIAESITDQERLGEELKQVREA